MATITDTLQTVLKVLGANEYARAFDQAADANKKLAKEQKASEGAVSSGATRFAQLGIQAGIVARVINEVAEVLERVGQFIEAASKPFQEFEQSLFSLEVVFKNLGRAADIPEIEAFNRQIADTTGVTTTAVNAMTQLLIRFKFSQEQIERATPVLIDFAKATGEDLPHAAYILESAMRGQQTSLQAFGVNIDTSKTRVEILDSALRQLNERFAGGAEAQKNTLTGSLELLAANFNELMVTVGRLFGPALSHFVNVLTLLVRALNAYFTIWAILLEAAGLLAPLSANTAGIPNASADAIKQQDALDKIEKNTRQTANAVTRQFLGGGPLAQSVLGDRGLNQAIRSVR